MVHTVTENNFEQLVESSEGTVLLDFWAGWCGPCRMMSPVVEQIAQERGDVTVGKVNVDEEGGLARRFGIMSIPSSLVFKGGKLVSRTAGALAGAGTTQNTCFARMSAGTVSVSACVGTSSREAKQPS